MEKQYEFVKMEGLRLWGYMRFSIIRLLVVYPESVSLIIIKSYLSMITNIKSLRVLNIMMRLGLSITLDQQILD